VIIPSGFFREVVSNISAYYESGNLWATAYAATANTLLFGSAIGRRLGLLFVPQAWTLPVELGFFIFWHPLYCALEPRPYSFCAPASS
jgi:hypothetical protein